MAGKLIALLLLSTFLIGCQSDQKIKERNSAKTKHPINPNGDSELALLMRDMFEESDSLKQLVADGKSLTGLKKYKDIHSAVPTDPAVKGPVFEAFAQAYVASINELESADSASIFKFNSMVDKCMNCHTEFCPGPKKRIKKLYIEE